jgi:hypothetical protein
MLNGANFVALLLPSLLLFYFILWHSDIEPNAQRSYVFNLVVASFSLFLILSIADHW